MIIRSLKLTNFRQFSGQHEFEFGIDDKNITIILGENGKGKTGVFRALMFVLYGETKLKQDNQSEEIQLVNFDLLDKNIENPVSAEVELTFEFQNKKYVIQRSITSIKSVSGKIESRKNNPNLFSIKDQGDFVPEVKIDPDEFINNIVNNEISDFFFFDAEKMSLLDNAKSSRTVSKEVHNGIIRLLQIKSLSEASELLNQMLNEKTSEINRKAKNSNLEQLNNDKDIVKTNLNNIEIRFDNLHKEKSSIVQEIEDIDKKLSGNEEISKIQIMIENEKEKLELSNQLYMSEKKKIKQNILNGINLLALPLLEKNEANLNSVLNSKSDKIPLDIIEQSLDGCQCVVCQTEFENDSRQYTVLEQIKSQYTYSQITPIIQNAVNHISQIKNNEHKLKQEIRSTIDSVLSQESTNEELKLKIERLENNISGEAITLNLDALDNQRVKLKDDLVKNNDDISRNSFEKETLTKQINELDIKIDISLKKLNGMKQDNAIREKIKNMHEILLKVKESYTEDISETLAVEMTNNFFELLDKNDRGIFDRVVIDADFNIKLLDNTGINRAQELSMGQGQIFTLAFILSLAKLASKGRNEIGFPLFMDTPFGRLSGTNRDNLIEHIPDMTNQWVLLLTDTELTNVEREHFEKFNKVGKIYELKLEDNVTRSVELNSLKDINLRRVNQ